MAFALAWYLFAPKAASPSMGKTTPPRIVPLVGAGELAVTLRSAF
jgi:hypothetical protein